MRLHRLPLVRTVQFTHHHDGAHHQLPDGTCAPITIAVPQAFPLSIDFTSFTRTLDAAQRQPFLRTNEITHDLRAPH